jgi:hypothetical protein
MAWLTKCTRRLAQEAATLSSSAAHALRVDLPLGLLLVVYLALWLPPIARLTQSPFHLNSFAIDEAMITQQLVAMEHRPYGNPANYMAHWDWVPAEWGSIRFFGVYYGGFYLDLGFLLLWPLHLLGLPDFPAAPIILRGISILAGALCLIVLYNFARRNFGRVAACGSALLLLTESTFAYFCPLVHPDTLQLALVLLALWAAQVHVERGELRSLLLLGALAGLVQGTKFAGIWLVPLALVAVVWGLDRSAGMRACMRQACGRLTLLGLMSGLCYFLSTPYAFFGSYYFHHWRLAWQNYQQPLMDTSLARWWEALLAHEGKGLVYLSILALGILPLRCLCRKKPIALVLSAVLLLTVLAWALISSRVWISFTYALPALALAGLFVAEMLATALHWLTWLGRPGRLLRAGLCLGGLWYFAYFPRAFETIQYTLNLYNRQLTTDLQFNAWALEHLPRDSRIVVDAAAYIDPGQFPRAKMHGGLITYDDLEELKPDYLVLSGSLHNAATIKEQRKDPHGNKLFLFYHDLLDGGGIPQAELMATVATPSSAAPGTITIPSMPLLSILVTRAWEVFVEPRISGEPILVYRFRRGT